MTELRLEMPHCACASEVPELNGRLVIVVGSTTPRAVSERNNLAGGKNGGLR